MANFLSQLYNREVSESDTVTVIHFSEIMSPAVLERRILGG
jgi:hypothetical protein